MSPNRILDGDVPMHRVGIKKPLIGLLVTLFVTALFYRLGDNEIYDIISAGIISFCLALGAFVILIFTERWTWRAVGLMISVGGAALTHLFLLAGITLESIPVNTSLNRSIIRAHLCVGGIILALGIISWGRDRYRKKHRQDVLDFLDPRDHYVK